MHKGSFINRKLAKGPGQAQRKARLAQEAARENKAVPSKTRGKKARAGETLSIRRFVSPFAFAQDSSE